MATFRNRSVQKAGLRMSMRDISDRKQMEESLRTHSIGTGRAGDQRALKIVQLEQRRLHNQKLASLGQVSASIAHEINNPLAGIKNAVWLVRQDPQTTESSKELLKCVDDELNRIAKLLQQINQLCRPSTSSPKAIDILSLIQDVMRGVDATIRQFDEGVVTDAVDPTTNPHLAVSRHVNRRYGRFSTMSLEMPLKLPRVRLACS